MAPESWPAKLSTVLSLKESHRILGRTSRYVATYEHNYDTYKVVLVNSNIKNNNAGLCVIIKAKLDY